MAPARKHTPSHSARAAPLPSPHPPTPPRAAPLTLSRTAARCSRRPASRSARRSSPPPAAPAPSFRAPRGASPSAASARAPCTGRRCGRSTWRTAGGGGWGGVWRWVHIVEMGEEPRSKRGRKIGGGGGGGARPTHRLLSQTLSQAHPQTRALTRRRHAPGVRSAPCTRTKLSAMAVVPVASPTRRNTILEVCRLSGPIAYLLGK